MPQKFSWKDRQSQEIAQKPAKILKFLNCSFIKIVKVKMFFHYSNSLATDPTTYCAKGYEHIFCRFCCRRGVQTLMPPCILSTNIVKFSKVI